PEIAHAGGARSTPCVGVATGSPVATALANLYLDPLDHELLAVPGAFYARYGDDLVFAHPDVSIAAGAEILVRQRLAERGLALNERKLARLYLNGAGRAGATGTRGATAVVYLGCRIDFAGTVGLPAAKCRELLSDVRQRLGRTAALLAGAPMDER